MTRLEKIFRVKMSEGDYNLVRKILMQARSYYWGNLPYGKVLKTMCIEWAESQREIQELKAKIEELSQEEKARALE